MRKEIYINLNGDLIKSKVLFNDGITKDHKLNKQRSLKREREKCLSEFDKLWLNKQLVAEQTRNIPQFVNIGVFC